MGRYLKKYARNHRRYDGQLSARPNELKRLFFNRGLEMGLKTNTLRKYWYWTRRLILKSKPLLHPSQMADNYVISFVDDLVKDRFSKISLLQSIDALRFLYKQVIRNRTYLVNELVKRRKLYAKNNKENNITKLLNLKKSLLSRLLTSKLLKNRTSKKM